MTQIIVQTVDEDTEIPHDYLLGVKFVANNNDQFTVDFARDGNGITIRSTSGRCLVLKPQAGNLVTICEEEI